MRVALPARRLRCSRACREVLPDTDSGSWTKSGRGSDCRPLRTLPRAASLMALSRLNALVDHRGLDTEVSLALVSEWVPGPLQERARLHLKANPASVIFSSQVVTSLALRVLVRCVEPDEFGSPTVELQQTLGGLCLSLGQHAVRAEPDKDGLYVEILRSLLFHSSKRIAPWIEIGFRCMFEALPSLTGHPSFVGRRRSDPDEDNPHPRGVLDSHRCLRHHIGPQSRILQPSGQGRLRNFQRRSGAGVGEALHYIGAGGRHPCGLGRRIRVLVALLCIRRSTSSRSRTRSIGSSSSSVLGSEGDLLRHVLDCPRHGRWARLRT